MAGRPGFTTRASCLLAAGATALVCGVVLGIVDLARAGVLALAVPLLAAVVVMRAQVRIVNKRSAEPNRAASGDTVVVHLAITNRSLLPTGSLMLEDQLPPQLRGHARFVLDSLHSRETRTVSYRMPGLPRGRYRSGPLHIRLTDPFHLVDVRRSFTATNEIVVTPVVELLRRFDPPRSPDVGDNAGSHSIGAHGADDASTREYRTGDDLRKIHWRSSARTGALMVRQEERPWQGELTMLLDTRETAHVQREPDEDDSPDERVRSSLEWAISAAASIATSGIVAGRPVGLLDEPGVPVGQHLNSSGQLGEHLAALRPSPARDLTAFEGSLRTSGRESTVIAILGEVDADTLRMLGGLRFSAGTAAHALLLDARTWAQRPGPTYPSALPMESAIPTAPDSPAGQAARVLRAAGWNTLVVRCGDPVGATVGTLFRPAFGSALGAVR